MIDFYEAVDRVVKLLQQCGRLTCRALKLQFKLDDETGAATSHVFPLTLL